MHTQETFALVWLILMMSYDIVVELADQLWNTLLILQKTFAGAQRHACSIYPPLKKCYLINSQNDQNGKGNLN